MSRERDKRRQSYLKARRMSDFLPSSRSGAGRELRRDRKGKLTPNPKAKKRGKRGPLSGTRVQIVHDHPRHGLTGRLTHRYMKWGAYYCLLDSEVYGQPWETVVRRGDYEVIV